MSTSFAQDATGTVLGTVVDPQGSVVPGVDVTVTNTATGQKSSTKSGQDGSFRLLNLPIGNYTVTAARAGFQTLVTKEQKLQINQNLRFDIAMKVGSAQETVEVASDAVGVETVSSTVGESVTGRSIIDLPLNGRNTLDLALSQPGVTETNDDTGAAGTFSIAGGRSDSVTFLLDGGLNNNLLNNGVVFNPNPDTVAEFRVLQNNYTAEYGRNGGGIVSVVTKSGGNQFHGSVFDFLRNDAMDANRYFNKTDPDPANWAPRDVLKRNQYGATLGGPILKDKLFFFVGYQGQRQSKVDSQGTTTVFTPSELNGDFSGSDPLTKDYVACFLTGLPQANVPCTDDGTASGNPLPAHPYYQPNAGLAAQGIIDPTRIDPVAQKYIAAGLVPSNSNAALLARGSSTDNRNEITFKVDYALTKNDKLSFTVGGNRVDQLLPFYFATVPGYAANSKTNNYFANIAYTRTFTNAVLNEFRFTAQRNNRQQDIPSKKLATATDLGVAISPDLPSGPPLLSFDSGMNIGFGYSGPTYLINNTFSYSDTFSWVKGRHTLKFGGGFTPYQNNTVYDYIGDGWFDFYSGASDGTGGTNGSGSPFADFLLGIPGDFFQYPNAPSNIRSKNTYFFGQDEWHIGRRLVLTYGLRYEYSTPKLDTAGRSFSVIPGLQSTRFTNAPLGLVFPGDKGAPRGANFPDKNDFAPRFGFALDPSGDGKWSIRGGIGMFYDILKGEDNLQFNGQPPFFSAVGLYFDPPGTGSYTCPNSVGTSGSGLFCDPFGSTGAINPFPSTTPTQNLDFSSAGFLPINGGGSVYLVDPHIRTPYTYQYNLGIQHELAKGTLMELTYVGSSSHKLTALQAINPMDPTTIFPVFDNSGQFVGNSGTRVINANPALDSCNNDPNNQYGMCYAYLPEFRNVGTQSYNALDASLTRQMTDTGAFGRTYFTFGYTWSHTIDNVSGFRQRSYQVPVGNPQAFRASSDQDLRHRITFSGGWDMAFDKWWGSGPKRLTEGWSLYPIFTWRSGFPYDIAANFADAYDITAAGPSNLGDPILGYANIVGPTTLYNPRKPQDFGSGSGAYWFDPNSFSNACEYVTATCTGGYGSAYGSLPRNHFRGPNKTNLDMTLAKNTKITERVNLQLRVDAFNLFNHAQFKNPDTNIYSGTFGQITDTYDPRILQLGARFSF